MSIAIESLQLIKRYPGQKKEDRPAIDTIDLTVESGQLYGLVGPDGAGKTTLLRILSTVMEPTSGSARLAGFDVMKQSEDVRALLGYMPQAFSLYPDLTVMENLKFFADINGVSAQKQKTRIDELLEFARLTEFTMRRSENLSGGMRKKLALACALIHDPKILLLDEPTTGVDPVSRRELWRLLSKVIQQGVTVLVSTPYMDEAERCNTVSIINRGRVLISGAPAELEAQLPFRIVEVKAKPRRALRAVADRTEGVIRWRAVRDRL
ncbi:MAG: multidrug ABC transporter ATP-binding protein, partial [Chloroflexi bacterium]